MSNNLDRFAVSIRTAIRGLVCTGFVASWAVSFPSLQFPENWPPEPPVTSPKSR
ncbi:hypothetical protein [Jannaschia aquimarina]|uniref:Uncharacterized protein n=1 Tax=Jannaschia aquimarina TaxID=935700 RepID=A0A0D1EHC7_9RHOB|nr:hypothetical protein [Jannaschia aquimarina]KIT15230.1 hypothetical protein jaqu_30530 [Jannaschia aquimarina]SNT32590.1 hypothetical protein SAMN05421775_11173 [Jannaschia aquimarina]